MFKINELYATVRYKRAGDDNADSDPTVKLIVNGKVSLIYFSPSFIDSRDMGSNGLIKSVDPDFTIYDPEYENKNDGDERFEKLFGYRTHYGNTNIYYHDKLTNIIIVAKFVTGLDSKLFPNRVFNLPITIFTSPKINSMTGNNNISMVSSDTEFIYVPKSNTMSSPSVFSLIIKGDKASSIDSNVRCHLNSDYGATANIMASNFIRLSIDDIDLDKSKFNFINVYEYDKYRDDTIVADDLNSVDYIYFPLDI